MGRLQKSRETANLRHLFDRRHDSTHAEPTPMSASTNGDLSIEDATIRRDFATEAPKRARSRRSRTDSRAPPLEDNHKMPTRGNADCSEDIDAATTHKNTLRSMAELTLSKQPSKSHGYTPESDKPKAVSANHRIETTTAGHSRPSTPSMEFSARSTSKGKRPNTPSTHSQDHNIHRSPQPRAASPELPPARPVQGPLATVPTSSPVPSTKTTSPGGRSVSDGSSPAGETSTSDMPKPLKTRTMRKRDNQEAAPKDNNESSGSSSGEEGVGNNTLTTAIQNSILATLSHLASRRGSRSPHSRSPRSRSPKSRTSSAGSTTARKTSGTSVHDGAGRSSPANSSPQRHHRKQSEQQREEKEKQKQREAVVIVEIAPAAETEMVKGEPTFRGAMNVRTGVWHTGWKRWTCHGCEGVTFFGQACCANLGCGHVRCEECVFHWN